ncbi:MAG: GNAT family N-acetyltransferase [Terrisporobacter sp.]|uniref:GNAT family N-acetyltransferase n=1 Tax=Terrisporobacter sp. TaxID=1965305 RepID=UPI002FCA19EB
MIKKCTSSDYEVLIKYLTQESVYNTFLIADIENYGFCYEHQNVYMQKDVNEKCCGVFLTYFNNLILSGDAPVLNYEFIQGLITDKITTVMGKAEILKKLSETYKEKSKYIEKNMYILPNDEKLFEENETKIGNEDDIQRIYDFLMTIPSFKELYGEKEMLINRIKNNEGVHVYIEEEGKLVAHGNSAASTNYSSMIGGLCVEGLHRKQGLFKKVVSRIGREILKQNKIPCIFVDDNQQYSIFPQLGFEVYGKWGVLQIIK